MPSSIPSCPTVTGYLLDTRELTGDYWYRGLRHTVHFDRAVRTLLAEGHGLFVEVSPHPVLLGGIEETVAEQNADAVAVGSLRRGEGGADRFVRSMAEAHAHGPAVDWRPLLAPADRRRGPVPTH